MSWNFFSNSAYLFLILISISLSLSLSLSETVLFFNSGPFDLYGNVFKISSLTSITSFPPPTSCFPSSSCCGDVSIIIILLWRLLEGGMGMQSSISARCLSAALGAPALNNPRFPTTSSKDFPSSYNVATPPFFSTRTPSRLPTLLGFRNFVGFEVLVEF